jgi:hypothetical protein
MLSQGLDAKQGLIPSGSLPIRQQFIVPESSPLPDKAQGSPVEASGQHFTVHRDRSALPGVISVEMGHRVVTLVPVHVDNYAVKRTNARHV